MRWVSSNKSGKKCNINGAESVSCEERSHRKITAVIFCLLLIVSALTLAILDDVGIVTLPIFHSKPQHAFEQWEEVSATINLNTPPDLSRTLADDVSDKRLRDTLVALCDGMENRHIANPGNGQARDYLISQLETLGFSQTDGTLEMQDFEWVLQEYRYVWRLRRMDIDKNGNIVEPEHEIDDEDDNAEDDRWVLDGDEIEYEPGEIFRYRGHRCMYKWRPHVELVDVKYSSKNIIATVPAHDIAQRPQPAGSQPDGEQAPSIITLCCHYDDVRDVDGAIDNASGVASALECARLIKDCSTLSNYEFRICFFSAEEQGCFGSREWLASLSQSERDRMVGAINLDMTGSSLDGNVKVLTISTYGVKTPQGYVNGSEAYPADNPSSAAAKRAFAKGDFSVPWLYHIHWDKHDGRSFDRQGLDCVTISWREIDPDRATSRFDICSPKVMHTADDNTQNFDFNSLSEATRLAVMTVEELCYGLKTAQDI